MNTRYIFSLLLLFFCFLSCKKYLETKPDVKLATPSTVQELQGILDYSPYMNTKTSEAGENASDNYYLTDSAFLALDLESSRKAYLWQPLPFANMPSTNDWTIEYNVVYNANVVLDNIQNITRETSNASAWDYCKGSALFFRAKAFYEIAQIWTKAYDSSTADNDLGIPLRLVSDFNIPSTRSTLQNTYDQIINDLKSSISLMPITPFSHPFRPYKAAAFGLLSRTYLTVRNFSTAKLYADSCLQLKNDLLDYNTINASASFPFNSIRFTNPEDIFHSYSTLTNYNIYMDFAKVDSNLYNLYNINDLRKSVFFRNNGNGTYSYKGSYDGADNGGNKFSGIATDEIYLIRAECFARQGNVSASMTDLNAVLSKRWKTGTFVPVVASSSSDALNQVLTERRKELPFRMLRFTDIKRLNKEGANIVQKRVIQGLSYMLPANDLRYALPIPDDIITLTKIQQNPGW